MNKAARTIEKALKTGIDQRHPGHRYITVQRSYLTQLDLLAKAGRTEREKIISTTDPYGC